MQSINEFGVHILADSIGEAWLELVENTLSSGEECYDEGRKRKALFDVRLKIRKQKSHDLLTYKYGNIENIKSILDLTFSNPEMHDIDVVPSFSNGPKSYFKRIQEGNMLEFIVERLSKIPESKKANMVFPTYEDYEKVLANPKDDYLPCLVLLQYRLKKSDNGHFLNTNAYFRSIDAYQKAYGNLEAITTMTELISGKIEQKLSQRILPGYLDVVIADTHIYEECLGEANQTMKKYKSMQKSKILK